MNQKPIRVLFMASTASKSGGSFHSLVGLAQCLRDQGLVNPFIVLPDHGSGEELLMQTGLKYRVVRSFGAEWPLGERKSLRKRLSHFWQRLVNRRATKFIANFAREERIDLVHINTSVDEVGYWVARRTKLPFVWYIREFIKEGLNLEFYSPKKQLRHIRRANAVIAISEALRERYESVLGRSDIKLIHNGIDVERFHFDRIQRKDGIVRFVSVGRISRLKGHHDMAKAFAILFQEGRTDFHMSFVGDCDKGSAETIRNLGLSDHVSLLGFTDDIPSILAQSDVYVSGHPWEAFGRALAEAMVSGCLGVGVDNAGTRDLIVDGETGRLYAPGDITAMANILRECLDNPQERNRLAVRGMSYAREHFTIQRCASEVWSVYQDVLAHGGREK